jgi:glycosyltransferase involved in cell wall biosynthesis
VTEAFSVLLPCYTGDSPDALEAAFLSVTAQQTRRPDQVVLVQDGPVSERLGQRITDLVEGSVVPTTLVVLRRNLGLGVALTRGLEACEHDIVARMDADDVSDPERFEIQVPLVESGVDVLGSALLEFQTRPEVVVGSRAVLTDPAEIAREARLRQTFNHPSVVYRASLVRRVGGYEDLPGLEDYLLFAKMIMAGARVGNVSRPLVRYRVSEGAYARRGGWGILHSELELQRRFRRMGFTTRAQYARNVIVRAVYRLVPEQVRRTAYQRLLAGRGDRPA